MSEKQASNFSEQGNNLIGLNQEEWNARSEKVNPEEKKKKTGATEVVNIEKHKKEDGEKPRKEILGTDDISFLGD